LAFLLDLQALFALMNAFNAVSVPAAILSLAIHLPPI
jgi:hypothetical protein